MYPGRHRHRAQAFLCRLIEDYADKWLWRPAMHYRWSYFSDRQLLGTLLEDQVGWVQ